MDSRGTLRAVTLELRRILEGSYDSEGRWEPGDLERRLGEIGVWRQREARPADEISHRLAEDHEARHMVDAWLAARIEAGMTRDDAVATFVRESAYTWANRLLALRCMEARDLIDEVVLQKPAYGGRSLQHHRLAQREPERCTGEDEGLFAVLVDEFARRAGELPLLFSLRTPTLALRPSVAALKRCVALLSGAVTPRGQDAATDEVFTAPEALGWTYMYWNRDEKDRVFEKVRVRRTKIEGAEIVPATCIYTERYMVRFLVQNSLGATWMAMHSASRLSEAWEYYVPGADRAATGRKPVRDLTFLDLACGSGHRPPRLHRRLHRGDLPQRAARALVCRRLRPAFHPGQPRRGARPEGHRTDHLRPHQAPPPWGRAGASRDRGVPALRDRAAPPRKGAAPADGRG